MHTRPPCPPCSCRARITKLERIPAEAGLYISPLTLQARDCLRGWHGQPALRRKVQFMLAVGANMQAMLCCRHTARKLTLRKRHGSWMRNCARSLLRRLAEAVLLQ